MDPIDLVIPTPSGDELAAWLFAPDGGGPHPVVVMAHGFAAIRVAGLDRFARRFAQAGIAALVFDYRGFGDSEGAPRHVLDVDGQRDDYRAAIRHVRVLEGLDPERIALWGTSFSGGHVIVLAAEEAGIAAAVAQVPFADGRTAVRLADPRTTLRLVVAGVRDRLAALAGRPPVYVPAVAETGGFATIATAGALEGYRRLHPPDAPWRNEVAARIVLRIPFERPITRASDVKCPLLVCVAEADDLTPATPAIAIAERAPKGELRRYAGGHFDVYFEPIFSTIVNDEIEFLRRTLGVRT